MVAHGSIWPREQLQENNSLRWASAGIWVNLGESGRISENLGEGSAGGFRLPGKWDHDLES